MGRKKQSEDTAPETEAGVDAQDTQSQPGEYPPVMILNTIYLHPDEVVVDEELNSRDATGNVSDLADSLLRDGQEQPIRVRSKDNLYHLVFGYRRHKAAAFINENGAYDHAQWPDGFKLRADVVECSDAQAFAANVRENAQRKDLSLMETCRAMDRQVSEFGASYGDVARDFGVSKSTVARNLKLAQAPRQVQKLVSTGKATAEAVLEIMAQPEENWEEGFRELTEEVKDSGKATKAAVRAKKRKKADESGQQAADNKRLGLKEIRSFWEGLRDEQLPEGADNTPQILADWVCRFHDGKFGDRAFRSRMSGLTLSK